MLTDIQRARVLAHHQWGDRAMVKDCGPESVPADSRFLVGVESDVGDMQVLGFGPSWVAAFNSAAERKGSDRACVSVDVSRPVEADLLCMACLSSRSYLKITIGSALLLKVRFCSGCARKLRDGLGEWGI